MKHGINALAESLDARSEAKPRPADARRARGDVTRIRILDAAESLFADRGFRAVTMRDIAAAAGVELSLTTHHFGSKQTLSERVLLRRSDEVFARTLGALERIERMGAPTPFAIFDAYIETFLVALDSEDPGWTMYMKLLLKRAGETSDAYAPDQPLMVEYRPIRQRYIRALQASLPGCDRASAAFSVTILEGALGYALFERSPDVFHDRATRARRIALLRKRLAPFLAAGVEATVAKDFGADADAPEADRFNTSAPRYDAPALSPS